MKKAVQGTIDVTHLWTNTGQRGHASHWAGNNWFPSTVGKKSSDIPVLWFNTVSGNKELTVCNDHRVSY